MATKRVFFVLMIAVLAAAIALAARVPLVSGQAPTPVKVELASYESNPVVARGAAGEWDSGFVFAGNVIYKDGSYHMFYAGGEDFSAKPHAIGYATSEDGLHWTKSASNPILKMNPAIASGDIPYAMPVVDGDTWVLYFNDSQYLTIRRATAPAPTGPWTMDEQPVLEAGGSQEWDAAAIAINTVFHDPDQYVLYYHPKAFAIGMATSPDGITWTKYNDPATTDPKYANSDPVFVVGEKGAWDSSDVVPTVLHTDRGWEMFYMGSGDSGQTWDLGYATSADGVIWTRFGDGPVMARPAEYFFWLEGTLIVDDQYYIYHDMFSATGVDLGVVVATVTWE